MGKYDNGISSYTEMNLDISVYFPEDEVKCKWCPFMRSDRMDRERCFITEEVLISRELIGRNCPLRLINKVRTEDLKE